MALEYELTSADAVAFALYTFDFFPDGHKRPRTQTWAAMALIGIGVLMALAVTSSRRTDADQTPDFLDAALTILIPASITMVGVGLLFRSRFLAFVLRRTMQKPENLRGFGRHKMKLSSEAITVEGPLSTTTLSWRAIQQIAVASQHIYLFFSFQEAYIVPRRAFANPSDFEEFLRKARTFQRSA